MFRDREDAGRQLARRLLSREFHDPLVLAIPRGGVVTGAVLATDLGAELDVVLARKLRAPTQPELAVGAISENGDVFLTREAAAVPSLTDEYLQRERVFQLGEIARRKKLFRNVRPQAPLAGRSVIVTDDGIATGSTMIAALNTIQGEKAREVIVAVPVASPDRLAEIQGSCDEVICLLSPRNFWAIGQFYRDFSPVEDDDVVAILRRFAPADMMKERNNSADSYGQLRQTKH